MDRSQLSAECRIKLTKAILALRRKDKHEAVMTSQLIFVEDWTCKAGWTDGKHLGINPQWIATRNLEQIRSFFAHENDHNRGGHPWRMRGLPRKLWGYFNRAADAQINIRLEARGFLPFDEGWVWEPEFAGMATEAIAWELWKRDQNPEPPPELDPQMGEGDPEEGEDGEAAEGHESAPDPEAGDQPGDDEESDSGQSEEPEEHDGDDSREGGGNEDEDGSEDGDEGKGDDDEEGELTDGEENGNGEGESEEGDGNGDGVEDSGGSGGDTDDLSDLDCRPFPTEGVGRDADREAGRGYQEYRKDLANAVRYAEANGGLDDAIRREVCEILDPAVPYEELLREFMDEATPDDFSWGRPQRDYYQRGIYCPSLHSEKLREVFYFVDTSGSMNERAFSQANGDVMEICEALGAKLRVFYIDNKIRGQQDFDPGEEDTDFTPKGGGGTDFRPGFTWIEENDEDPVAVIYLTDLRCNAKKWPAEPSYPVIFVKWGDWNHEVMQRAGMLPSWAVIVEMEEEHWREDES